MTGGPAEARAAPVRAPRRGASALLRAGWANLEEGALCVLLVVMTAITFATVVTRYVFDVPLSYIDQLVPNLFVWVTFLGASAAAKRRAHLGLSLVGDALPRRARAVLDGAVLAGTCAFFLGTAWYGWRVVRMQAENQLTTSLGYPAWAIGAAVPAGGALLSVRAFEAWRRRRRGEAAVPSSPPVA